MLIGEILTVVAYKLIHFMCIYKIKRIYRISPEKIRQELLTLEDLRPGSLSTQYNVCGNPNCRCKDDPPQKHGPYYQLSFSRKGRSSTKFVKRPHVAMVKKQLIVLINRQAVN